MDIQPGRPSQLWAWIAAIALIVFCAAGISALMGWVPTLTNRPADTVPIARVNKPAATPAKTASATVPAAPAARAKTKCRQCGVIKSVREAATSSEGAGYEVTVVFDDGTSLMISEAALPHWQRGDPVKVVNGVIRSDASGIRG